jgi:pimeloyl-ACP methyl ester carboxylesterase
VSAARGLEERFTSHQGRRLRYLVGGSGPHMLLCHGFIGSAENFAEWFGELLPRRTLIVPDLPGFGESMHVPGRHHAAALAEAAVTAVRDAGAHEYDLGGLCLGAGVALAVQRLRPADTRRLVLHTPLLAPHIVRKRFHVQVRVMTAPGMFPLIGWLSRRRVVSDAYKRIFVEGADVDAAAAQVNFDNQLRAHPRAAREWLLEGLRRDDAGALRSASHPVLILVAADDRIVNVPRMVAAAALGGRTRVAVIEEAGHGWTEASVRRQLELITAFLDDRPLPDRSGMAAA